MSKTIISENTKVFINGKKLLPFKKMSTLKKETELTYALFILASNYRLKTLIRMHKEDTEFNEEFACNNWHKYCPIKHVKMDFQFQWDDRYIIGEELFLDWEMGISLEDMRNAPRGTVFPVKTEGGEL